MSGSNSANLQRASWLRRVLQAHLPEGDYQIEYSSRSLTRERILINGQLVKETRLSSWFRPIFRFFVGARPAVIAVRVAPWLTIRSFHLLIDERVVYCDRLRDLFEGDAPKRSFPLETHRSVSTPDRPTDPLCPYCDRVLYNAGLDLSSLPVELMHSVNLVGRPTGVFTFARGQRLALFVAGILACCIGVAVLAAVWLLPVGNAAAEMHGRHSGQMLGLLLLGVGPVAFFFALKTRRLFAVTGRDGVALLENEAISSCRWRDIETVHETIVAGDAQSNLTASVRGEDHFYRVRCRDGTELVFRNHLNDLDWLGKNFEHETLPYLLPPAVEALKNGETLSFGPLTLDAEGLSAGPKKRLTWDEIHELKVEKASLLVMQAGKLWAWFKTLRGEIPNPHVLLALARLCQNGRRDDDRDGTSSV